MSHNLVVNSVVLSPQISESITLDFFLFPLIKLAYTRHLAGDFGEIDFANQIRSFVGFVSSGVVISKYTIEFEKSIYYGCQLSIITEADRSATIILFMGEL
jgi:hypothetical protein